MLTRSSLVNYEDGFVYYNSDYNLNIIDIKHIYKYINKIIENHMPIANIKWIKYI